LLLVYLLQGYYTQYVYLLQGISTQIVDYLQDNDLYRTVLGYC